MRANHADHDLGIDFLQVRGKLRIVRKRWRACVQHRQFVVLCERRHLLDRQVVRRSIDELAAGDHGSGLRQPRGIPERFYFAPRLIARARSAIEPLIARRVQKYCLHDFRHSNIPLALNFQTTATEFGLRHSLGWNRYFTRNARLQTVKLAYCSTFATCPVVRSSSSCACCRVKFASRNASHLSFSSRCAASRSRRLPRP